MEAADSSETDSELPTYSALLSISPYIHDLQPSEQQLSYLNNSTVNLPNNNNNNNNNNVHS
jgi:hypothetical protein